ncbi:hypothetical protein ACLOJK_016310 [Asimina triloba]
MSFQYTVGAPKIRCSIFPKQATVRPISGRLRSVDRSRSENRPRRNDRAASSSMTPATATIHRPATSYITSGRQRQIPILSDSKSGADHQRSNVHQHRSMADPRR